MIILELSNYGSNMHTACKEKNDNIHSTLHIVDYKYSTTLVLIMIIIVSSSTKHQLPVTDFGAKKGNPVGRFSSECGLIDDTV